MGSAIGLDASPSSVMRDLRGEIMGARIAYPEVLHIEVRDSHGDLWRLATQDAEWTPADLTELIGQSIEEVEIDGSTGELRCRLCGGVSFEIGPAAREAEDDPPNWELISPSGTVLEFGPGVRWQISGASEPRSAHR